MADSAEQRELSLVGKVELRIALVETDSKLEATLKTYLPPLLLKLASEHLTVRNKVSGNRANATDTTSLLDIRASLYTRLKQSIKLPVAALLKQYKENTNPLIRHFDLIYIQEGVNRLTIPDRLDLLPTLLNGFRTNYTESVANAASLFHLLLRLLHNLTLPVRGDREDLELRSKLGLKNSAEDAAFVALWIGKLLLLTSGTVGDKRGPGLESKDIEFLCLKGKKDIWTPEAGGLHLVETKVRAARFVASGTFVDTERFLPALFASVDPNSRLSGIGDDMLKRVIPAVSLEDPRLLEKLFNIYLGTRGSDGSLSARSPLQLKILGLLCKSRNAASFLEQSTQIIQEGLTPAIHERSSGEHQPFKQGLEASKLREQIFVFTNWLARVCSQEQMENFAPIMIEHLRAYIESQGWPKYDTERQSGSGELASRRYGYESIGLLAAACPQKLLLEPNIDLLRWLFNSLGCDPSGKETSISIEQALSSVMAAFTTDLTFDIRASLTELLLYQMSLGVSEVQRSGYQTVRNTRFVSVRFANRCLAFENPMARWINVLAIGDDQGRSEVVEEGKKGLDPYWHENTDFATNNNITKSRAAEVHSSQKFPKFRDLIAHFFSYTNAWSGAEAAIERIPSPKAYDAASMFCRNILIHQALDSTRAAPAIDVNWERNLSALIENDSDTRQAMRDYLVNTAGADSHNAVSFKRFLEVLFTGVAERMDHDAGHSAKCLRDLCALSPDHVLSNFAPKATFLQKAIYSSSHSLRVAASCTFGILASHPHSSRDDIQTILAEFLQLSSGWNLAVGVQTYQIHGTTLSMAFLFSRLAQRRRLTSTLMHHVEIFFKNVLDIVCESRDTLMVEGALLALSELSAYGVISLQNLPASHTFPSLSSTLKAKATSGNEKAILALGNLAMSCAEDGVDSHLADIINVLYSLHNIRQPEIQFAAGAALSSAAVGWASEVLIGRLDVGGSPPSMPGRERTLSSILGNVLGDCKTTKPSLRQASVIWLLCLVQYCGQLQDVRNRLRECQIAFKGFLADHDSLNRESAARGLTFVYEKGDKAIRDELVRDLVTSFTGTAPAISGSVSEQTQLFEPGALPTGDNQSITTYKDIMSLAAEVGDPSLVYRFMSMASNNAIWSSRATLGHFGLSKILSDSSVNGYLSQNPKLYPVLFRYRFDANSNVRESMNDIWKTLVKDSSAVIDKYFDSIMDDLLKNILGKEWRVRQACCAAIADLIQGRPQEKYERYLSQIWTLTFKVCDDIKGSVREAAQALARVLAGILTRSLEAGNSSSQNIDAMLKIVLPFLFSPSGLESSSKEIQVFSLSTLLDIIKSSNNKTLAPFVPDLVRQLIALLSLFENEGINYLHLNADKYGVTTQQIDDARLTGIKASPLVEAIERCLDTVDEQTMAKLQVSLEDAIKTAVGLPSKVGASRVLVSLSTRHNFIFRPYADVFLGLARKQLLDRNDTIASAYASACGYLARIASDDEIAKIFQYCRQLYFDSDNDRYRVVAGDVVHATSKHATDRFNSLGTEVLPFVFVAKHDPLEQVKTLFENTWNENVGGTRSVSLYLTEIVQIAFQHLDSPRWSVKHTSAFTVAECINSLGDGISDASAKILWPALEKAIAGKTWEGKERVLQAFVNFARSSNPVTSNIKIAEQIKKIVIRESKRNNVRYRQEALASLGAFVDSQEDSNMFSQVLEITAPVIQACSDDSTEMDVDSTSGGSSSKVVRETTLANALSALIRSVNPSLQKETDLSLSLKRVLECINGATATGTSRLVQEAIYEAETKLFDKMKEVNVDAELEETLVCYAKSLSASHDQVERIRFKASEVMISLLPIARKSDRIGAVLNSEITNALAIERSVPIQISLKKARDGLGR